MKHEAQVIMLPTEDKTGINLYLQSLYIEAVHHDNDIPFGTQLIPMPSEVSVPQHLYITIPQDVEPLKRGDYYLCPKNILRQCGNSFQIGARKIIATTNKKLRIQTFRLVGGTTFPVIDIQIPQIPQSFIKEYCDKGGIDKVLVEYDKTFIRIERNVAFGIMTKRKYNLKLNPDNTIIIYPLEEKMYNRKDTMDFAFHAIQTCRQMEDIEADKWIKENL